MYFMEQVADELMRRNGDGDSTRANLDMMLDDDGKLVFASFRGSPPDLAGPTFPRTGDLIVAELCWLDSAWTDGLPIKTSCAARSMLGRINATGM